DRLSVTGALKNNEVITIKRVTVGQAVRTVPVPFVVQKQKDPSSYVGSDTVVRQGANGTDRVTYQLLYLDGKLIGQVPMITKVLSPGISELLKVGSKAAPTFVATASGAAQKIAAGMVAARGWGADQFSCLVSLWSKESGWRTDAANPSGAYGIPQALPGDKMASVGPNWQSDAATQITWGLNYIAGTYGTPCAAWGHSQATNWY
ncbi:MAG TPA: G5 domain-containing protein, partial [Jatrophihabitans sp.]